MKRLLLVLGATLIAGSANAGLPLFAAKCPTNLNVDADRHGVVRVNGEKATVKKFSDQYYEATHAGVTIGIGLEAGGPPSVNYTGKHGVNGVCEVLSYKVSGGESAPASGHSHATSSERAGQGQFDASGNIPCAQSKGQPMGQCHFGVARDGGGSATVVVTRPDGRKRAIFFEKGKAISADLSQADGNMAFHATKHGDVYKIQAGDERYEIPEAVVFGG